IIPIITTPIVKAVIPPVVKVFAVAKKAVFGKGAHVANLFYHAKLSFAGNKIAPAPATGAAHPISGDMNVTNHAEMPDTPATHITPDYPWEAATSTNCMWGIVTIGSFTGQSTQPTNG